MKRKVRCVPCRRIIYRRVMPSYLTNLARHWSGVYVSICLCTCSALARWLVGSAIGNRESATRSRRRCSTFGVQSEHAAPPGPEQGKISRRRMRKTQALSRSVLGPFSDSLLGSFTAVLVGASVADSDPTRLTVPTQTLVPFASSPLAKRPGDRSGLHQTPYA